MTLSTRAKAPISATKKKSLSATTVRTKKRSSQKSSHADGSYLQVGSEPSSVSAPPQSFTSVAQGTGPLDPNQAILSALSRLEAANQDLARRMERMERGGDTNSTPVPSPRPRETVSFNLPRGPRLGRDPSPIAPLRAHPQGHHGAGGREAVTSHQSLPNLSQAVLHRPLPDNAFTGHPEAMEASRDAIVPSVEAVRNIPNISAAVSKLLAQYEDQTHQDIVPGKDFLRKKSGRYNTTDTCTARPELRWPNEGCVSTGTTKKPSYDDLTMAQRASGQLSNILLIQDFEVMKRMLTQLTMALTDAVSLPWPAVRSAWAASMTQVEDGRLSWANDTQWALNRIGMSQVAVFNSQNVLNHQKVRICRYFNEGSCVHDFSHGNYKHLCSHCYKQGRSLSHPEIKCNLKSNKQTTATSR